MRVWLLTAIFLASCGGQVIRDEGDPNSDGGSLAPADEDGGASTVLTVGGTARVTADSLNLRDGVGTGASILTAMPCGAQVQVVGGPSTTPAAGWWNVTWENRTGWASGKYLTPEASFDSSLCGAGSSGGDGGTGSVTIDDIFARARLGVGYSYYWGHGSWRADAAQVGACMGSCPSCTHSGQYGADCSGFVAKAWQVPQASALEVDEHPYSTYNFYNDTTHWRPVPRSTLQPADALVHRTSSSGHIVLVESTTDPFGDTWVYEARGCATGVVHDLRTLDSTYIAIRREGL